MYGLDRNLSKQVILEKGAWLTDIGFGLDNFELRREENLNVLKRQKPHQTVKKKPKQKNKRRLLVQYER